MPYRYVIDQVADETMALLPRREQRRLRDLFRRLAEHPFAESEQRVVDADGRVNDVITTGRFVVTYWVDHAVSQVRIAAVEFL